MSAIEAFPNRQVRLAAEAAFRLGGAQVNPAACEVSGPGWTERLEPRVMQVLVVLAQAGGATVTREALFGRCWNSVVVGEDALIRAIGRLRRLAQRPGAGFRIETLPRIGYRLVVGEPEAAVVRLSPTPASPAELTAPEGRPIRIGRRAMLAAGAVAAASAAAGAAWLTWPRPAVRPRLVAVLPFDGDGEPEGAQLAESLSDAVMTSLTRVRGLPVAARYSAFQFRGPEKARAPRALKASHIVDGSVRRRGGQLEVTAYLTDAERGVTLWSERIEAPARDILIVQEKIASRVAQTLHTEAAGPRAQPLDPDIYDLHLRAERLLMEEAPEGVDQALLAAQTVVRRAPGFAQGWATLARAHSLHANTVPPALQGPDETAARRAAERALQLDPRLGQVYGVLAARIPRFGRWGEVESLLKRGLAISPDSIELRSAYAGYLFTLGRGRESLSRYLPLLPLDPLNPQMVLNIASVRFDTGDTAGGLAEMQAAYDRWPTFHHWSNLAASYATAGQFDRAIGLIDRATHPLPPGLRQVRRLAYVAARDRRPADIAATIKNFEAMSRTGTLPAMTAISAMNLIGEPARALAIADTIYRLDAPQAMGAGTTMHLSYVPRGQARAGLLFSAATRPMRALPGFMPILERIGLVAYWRASGTRPDFCAEPGLPPRCRAVLGDRWA